MTIVVESVSNTPTLLNRTNSTITAPTGIQNGNLLVALLHIGDPTGVPPLAITPPAGFVEVTNSPSARDNIAVDPGNPYTIAMHVWTKVASGESGNYTFTHTAADSEGYMYRLSGIDTSTSVDVNPAALQAFIVSGEGTRNGQTTNYASLTTVTDNSFLIFAESVWDAVGSGTVSGTTPTITARRVGSISWIGDGLLAAHGATSQRTRANGNLSIAIPWASIVVAIRPSVALAPFVLGDYVLDNGLSGLDAVCDKIYVCSQAPTTYTEAITTYGLGNKNWSAGNAFASPATQSPNGRQITSIAITDGSITANGTVAAWAAVDTANSRLLASGNLTGGKAVTSGQTFTLTAMTFGIPNQ